VILCGFWRASGQEKSPERLSYNQKLQTFSAPYPVGKGEGLEIELIIIST
jgi:hypothetical protein